MMALEEKFDLTLDEEGKQHSSYTTVACLVCMHTAHQVLFSILRLKAAQQNHLCNHYLGSCCRC